MTISPHSLKMPKTIDEKFSFDEAWFTDQNNRPLEIEDDVKLALIIGIGYSTESKKKICVRILLLVICLRVWG